MSLQTPSNSRLSGGRSLPKAFALGALFALAGSFGLAPGAHAQPIESESLDSPTAAATGELAELEQLAQESFTQDDLETAVALYRQLAGRHESTGEKVRILTTVAWLEHERGRAQSALETLTRVLVMQPEYSIRPDLYSDAFTALFYDAQKNALEEREAKASRLVRAGAEQLRERRYDEARRSFQDALATWSEQPKAIYNLALVDYYQSRDDEALGGFQKLLALASSRPDLVPASLQGLALTNLGLLYLNQNQPDEAGRVLEDAVRLTPSSGTAWSNLAITRRRLGDPGGAADAARKALDLAPDDVGAHRSLALALLDADRPQEAAELLVRSTRDFAEDGGLWLYSGLADRRLGRAREAEAALRRAVDRDPGNADGWASPAALQLAALAYERTDLRETLRQAEQVVAWNPGGADGFSYLGLAKAGLGDLEGAREGLETSRRLDPVDVETHNNLGSVYYQLDRLDAAQEAFERALSIAPDHPGARRNLQAVQAARRGDRVRSAPSLSRPSPAGSRPAPPPQSAPPPQAAPRAGARASGASLGWVFSNVDYASLGLQGVMLERVVAASAAERAGLASGDLLLKVDGEPVRGGAELDAYVRSRPAGGEVVIELLRNNRPIRVSLRRP